MIKTGKGRILIIKNIILISAVSLMLIAYNASATSYVAEDRIDFLRMNSEIKMFRVLCKRYPQNLEELNNRPTSCKKSPYKEDKEKIKITDLWDRPYYYTSPKKHKRSPHNYDLHSYGKDGVVDTADDLYTWMD